MITSAIPQTTARGTIVRQLHHGHPHLVFIQDAGGLSRCVCEVADTIAGYKRIGVQLGWQSDTQDDPMMIAAEYLAQRNSITA